MGRIWRKLNRCQSTSPYFPHQSLHERLVNIPDPRLWFVQHCLWQRPCRSPITQNHIRWWNRKWLWPHNKHACSRCLVHKGHTEGFCWHRSKFAHVWCSIYDSSFVVHKRLGCYSPSIDNNVQSLYRVLRSLSINKDYFRSLVIWE